MYVARCLLVYHHQCCCTVLHIPAHSCTFLSAYPRVYELLAYRLTSMFSCYWKYEVHVHFQEPYFRYLLRSRTIFSVSFTFRNHIFSIKKTSQSISPHVASYERNPFREISRISCWISSLVFNCTFKPCYQIGTKITYNRLGLSIYTL